MSVGFGAGGALGETRRVSRFFVILFVSFSMINLCKIDNNNPALQLSPMICAAENLLAYLIDHDEIGLTKAKAFQRKFVHWAAANFDWPGFEEKKLFRVNKVLNEYDFPPLEMLHFVLLKLKLIRHYKGACKLTKAGKGLAGKPGELRAGPGNLNSLSKCLFVL